MAAAAILEKFRMAISLQRLTIYYIARIARSSLRQHSFLVNIICFLGLKYHSVTFCKQESRAFVRKLRDAAIAAVFA